MTGIDEPIASAPATRWRFVLGSALFVSGLFCPAFIPLLGYFDLPTSWLTALSGFFLLGLPEVLWLGAAVVLGREGFSKLKSGLWQLVRRHALPTTTGPVRYRVGLVLFSIPLLIGWLLPYFSELLPFYEKNRIVIALVGDGVFLTSLLVLGGDFWDKLRSLFTFGARATFPER